MRAVHFNASQAFIVPSPQIKKQSILSQTPSDSVQFGHGKTGPNPNARENDELSGFKRLLKHHLIPKKYTQGQSSVATRFEQWKKAFKPHFVSPKNHKVITQQPCNQKPYDYGKSG